MLFIHQATTTITIEPVKTGVTRKLTGALAASTTNGFAPAGACSVRVCCMAANASPTASAPAHHEFPRMLSTISPTKVDNTCPPIMLRGWASGDSGSPKASTQLAPKEAISQGTPEI